MTLEKLMKEYCPNGVEYVKIGDICTITKGKTPIQKAIPGEYPLVVTTSERKSSNTYQFDRSAVCIPLVSSRGHGVASLNHVYFQSGKFALGNILCAVIPNDESILSANFLYHYLEYKKDTLLVPLMKGGANVSLHIDDIQRVKIPLPPIEVQNRTIEILDKFVELSEALTKELSARQNQYKYYRDLLLDFGVHGGATDDCERKTFGEVVTFINGRAYKQAELLSTGKYKVVRVGNFFTNDKWYYSDLELEENKYCNYGDLLYCWAASLGPQIWSGEKTIFHYHIWKLEFDESKISKKYLYYFLKKDVDDMYDSLTQSTMPHVSMASMKERVITIPSLTEQKRIVSILDRFDKLCNDISEGLPAEIEARRKQYEYYRDKLLSF